MLKLQCCKNKLVVHSSTGLTTGSLLVQTLDRFCCFRHNLPTTTVVETLSVPEIVQVMTPRNCGRITWPNHMTDILLTFNQHHIDVRVFCSQVRAIISDFAVVIAIGVMVAVDAIIGLATPKLDVPTKFQVNFCFVLVMSHYAGTKNMCLVLPLTIPVSC